MEKELRKRLMSFRDSRGWKQFHDPKSLAVSIAIEASELLEIFQWITTETSKEHATKNIQKIKEEVADIYKYLEYFCDAVGLDPDAAIEFKMKQDRKKYPVSKARGNAKKYTDL